MKKQVIAVMLSMMMVVGSVGTVPVFAMDSSTSQEAVEAIKADEEEMAEEESAPREILDLQEKTDKKVVSNSEDETLDDEYSTNAINKEYDEGVTRLESKEEGSVEETIESKLDGEVHTETKDAEGIVLDNEDIEEGTEGAENESDAAIENEESFVEEEELVEISELNQFEDNKGLVLEDAVDYSVLEDEIIASGTILRNYLVQRNNTFEIATSILSNQLTEECVNLIFEEALKETGISNEGQYLRYSVYSYSFSINEFASDGYGTISFDVTYFSTNEQEQYVSSKITEVIESLNLDILSDYQKILRIYQYVTNNVNYDFYHETDDSYLLKGTAYAALHDGTAVCQGYAMLLHRLFLEAEINSRLIVGWLNGSNLHMWNNVELRGIYYECDATQDAIGHSLKDYLLKGSSSFTGYMRDERSSYEIFPVSLSDYILQEGDVPEYKEIVKDGVIYRIEDDHAVVIGNTGEKTEVRISDSIDGTPVTIIANTAFDRCEILREIIIPASITRIENGTVEDFYLTAAFNQCSNLEKVIFEEGSTLSYIGKYAFNLCSNLKDIVLPASLREIAMVAFWGCSSIKELNLPEGLIRINSCALELTSIKTLTIPSTCTFIDPSQDIHTLESISVADGNTVYKAIDGVLYKYGEWQSSPYLEPCTSGIGWTLHMYPPMKSDEVFYVPDFVDCVSGVAFVRDTTVPWLLKELNIGNAYIIAEAEIKCIITAGEDNPCAKTIDGIIYTIDGQTLVQVPESLTGAITIPEGVRKINSGSIKYTNIDEVLFPSTIEEIGVGAFMEAKIKSIVIPDAITEIESQTFQSCPDLTNVVLPAGLKSIGWNAFLGCHRLEEIIIPDTVTQIGNNAFAHCWNIHNIHLSESMDYIPYGMFLSSLAVDEFTIPSNIKHIQGYAFAGAFVKRIIDCLEIPESVNTIDEYAFFQTNVNVLIFHNAQCEIFDSAETIGDDIIIIGHDDSTAEAYAKKYNRRFVSLSHTHKLEEKASTPATCQEAGNIKYYKCKLCYKNFSDESGTQEISAKETIIPLSDHKWNNDYTVDRAATYTDEGSKSIHCVFCNIVKEGSEVLIPKLVNKLGKTTRGDVFNLANNVKVTWKEVPGAKYYKIYREGVTNSEESRKDPVIVTTGLVGWDNDPGLENGHAYRYKIVASMTGKGDSSGDSKFSYSKIMYRLKTVVIRSVKNTAPGKVTVKYDKTTSGDSYVLQYCEREDMVGAKTKVVLGANNTSYTIGGLKKGKTYYISIRVRKKVNGIDYYTTFGVPKKIKVTK